MKVVYTERVAADLESIADYITAKSPQAAENVRASILKTLENIGAFPSAGRQQMENLVRKVVVRRYPYLIYYSIDEDLEQVVILTIIHAARDNAFQDS